MKFHRTLSRQYARQFNCHNKDCFYNAWLAVGELSESYYIEGYAVSRDGSRFPIHHAWIEQRGRIIDPTPAWSVMEGTLYFPGFRFLCQDEIWEAAEAAGEDDEYIPVPVANYLGHDVPQLVAALKAAQDWQARQWGYDTYDAWMAALSPNVEN